MQYSELAISTRCWQHFEIFRQCSRNRKALSAFITCTHMWDDMNNSTKSVKRRAGDTKVHFIAGSARRALFHNIQQACGTIASKCKQIGLCKRCQRTNTLYVCWNEDVPRSLRGSACQHVHESQGLKVQFKRTR